LHDVHIVERGKHPTGAVAFREADHVTGFVATEIDDAPAIAANENGLQYFHSIRRSRGAEIAAR
jgi:hypothetical protein